MLTIMNFGAVVTMLTMIALALATEFWLLLLVVAVAGLAMGIGQPATMAWVSRISEQGQEGLAIAVRPTSNRLGQVFVPSIAGLVAGLGIGSVFLVLAFLQAISILVADRALRKRSN